MASAPNLTKVDNELADAIAKFYHDPLGHVYFAFPWGEENTPLAEWNGPDKWQVEVLEAIGEGLKTDRTATRIAVSSGNGSGKSALMSWLQLWWLSTRPNTKITATAGTKNQLATKLWPELAIWHQRTINQHWFEWQATSLKCLFNPAAWRSDAIPWNENAPDAFAGAHAQGGAFTLYDEASSVHDKIWETSEGALTDPGALWCAFGNPVRSSGRFFDCFHRLSHQWKTFKVDTRTARMVNQAQVQEWIDTYGLESDYVKVRVLGQFPSVGTLSFFDASLITRAIGNRVHPDDSDPKVLGVDVARFGDDEGAIAKRHGRRLLPLKTYAGLDTMRFAAEAAREIDLFEPDAVMVDGTGVGGGVVDRLREMGFRDVIDVQFGSKPDDEEKYTNKRTEMYGRLRDWLRGDVELPNDRELEDEMTGIEFGLDNKNRDQLERKKDMKKRLGRSPDRTDAVACTFAEPVRARSRSFSSLRDLGRDFRERFNRDWRTV